MNKTLKKMKIKHYPHSLPSGVWVNGTNNLFRTKKGLQNLVNVLGRLYDIFLPSQQGYRCSSAGVLNYRWQYASEKAIGGTDDFCQAGPVINTDNNHAWVWTVLARTIGYASDRLGDGKLFYHVSWDLMLVYTVNVSGGGRNVGNGMNRL